MQTQQDKLNDQEHEQEKQDSAVPDEAQPSRTKCSGASPVDDKASLETLPVELLDQAFGQLEIDSLIHVSLSGPFFWSVGRKHILNHFKSILGTWAGQSTICAGIYGKHRDYPPSMLTTEELKELEERRNLFCYFDEEYGFHPARHFLKSKLPDNAEALFDRWTGDEDRQKPGKSPPMAYNRWLATLASGADREVVRPSLRNYYPTDQKWILRNLTVKEFVRADAIAVDFSKIHGPYVEGVSFGDVVLSRICWGEGFPTLTTCTGEFGPVTRSTSRQKPDTRRRRSSTSGKM